MDRTPPEAMSLFSWTTSAEVSDADKAFILRIMKLDPRDRPTATELLEDKWFRTQPEVSSDNTAPQEHGGESLLDAVYG
jgi:serine/threonine protein kinase